MSVDSGENKLVFNCDISSVAESCSVSSQEPCNIGVVDLLCNTVNRSLSFIITIYGVTKVFSLSSFISCDVYYGKSHPLDSDYSRYTFKFYVDDSTCFSVDIDYNGIICDYGVFGKVSLNYSYRGLAIRETFNIDRDKAKELFFAIRECYDMF